MEVTLGGDRLGSGKKQQVELHNYHMSSFNQEQDFKSTIAPGILYPFLKLIGTNHGTFDINLDHFIRTLPTNGPLFGSFKFQADIFCVPIRLYQGILHNNPVDIGLKMDKVFLPKIDIKTVDGYKAPKPKGSNKYNYQIADSALLKYLGISGLGTASDGYTYPESAAIDNRFNAVPILAYYDIFKNYYANKQEEDAYVIAPGDFETASAGTAKQYALGTSWGGTQIYQPQETVVITKQMAIENNATIYLKYEFEDIDDPLNKIKLATVFVDMEDRYEDSIYEWIANSYCTMEEETNKYIIISINPEQLTTLYEENTVDTETKNTIFIGTIDDNEQDIVSSNITLKPFKLANIDKMRQVLLSLNEIADQFVLSDEFVSDYDDELYPYGVLVSRTANGINWNAFKQNGLVVKTYQSDLFNNWLNSDTIDLISQMTTMDTTNGFTMDDLNFMEKAYNVLNRIAISGGTYEDWQEAVYGEGAIRKAETPMYMGGMSAEIMFEEVIASTESGSGDEYQALGALGGKGTAVNKHGGNDIHIKCEEPCYILGICSITPRIAYSQGNDWDMVELESLNDLHKPGFDGIGFQDLMIDQMAWWNTRLVPQVGGGSTRTRHSAGKQIAWINYQTAVDKIYGDFADLEKSGFMVLNRNYERYQDADGKLNEEVLDLSTYIDPAKYNYAFSYTKLDAQNFWVQIHSQVVARRKMAAQQIPNL